MFEVAIEGVAGGNVEMRKRVADFFQSQVASLGNIQRARQDFRRILEHPVHLVMTLDVEVGALKLHSVWVLNTLAGLNTDHHILRVRVIFTEIVTVVGRYQREPEISLETKKIGVNAVLHLQALILDLKKEILFAENVGIGGGGVAR